MSPKSGTKSKLIPNKQVSFSGSIEFSNNPSLYSFAGNKSPTGFNTIKNVISPDIFRGSKFLTMKKASQFTTTPMYHLNNNKEFKTLFKKQGTKQSKATRSISFSGLSKGYTVGNNPLKKSTSTNSCYTSSYTITNLDNFNDNTQVKGGFLLKSKHYRYVGNHNNNNKKNGFGMVLWNDGSLLKAHFVDGKAQKVCTYYDWTDTLYTGEYVDNRPKGYGEFQHGEVTFIGEWKDNIMEGLGMEIWSDDCFFQGEFKDSIKEGIGVYRWGDGSIYQGEWKNNRINGYGIMKHSDDSVYAGEFVNGGMDGGGEFRWKDGKRYIGNYKDDLKHDGGTFIWSFEPLNAYVGFWEEGKQNGLGVMINGNKGKYGVWKKNKKPTWGSGSWEISQYLKQKQIKYKKFLEQNITKGIKYVMRLDQ